MGTYTISSLEGFNDEQFQVFLHQLRNKQPTEWQILLDMFRKIVVPWLVKKDGNLPKEAIVSTNEFVEEVFANSLYQFYESFEKGDFKNIGDLRGLMFRIAEFKLKEGYNKVRRDKLIYFTDDIVQDGTTALQDKLTLAEFQQKETVQELREHLKSLNNKDQEILIRYSKGEELGSIAENIGLTAASCRKRKQRALDKLRKFISKAVQT